MASGREGKHLLNQRSRKAVGCFVLLAYLAIYAMLASALGVWLAPLLPTWAELIFYAVAGVVWVFPLKPMFAWMNRQN